MNYEQNIQNEIDKTLSSLDNFQKQKAKPFLYTRIQAKLENEVSQPLFSWFFDTPILKPALATLIVALNIITILQLSNIDSDSITSEQTSLDNFTEEYAFNQSSESYFNLYNEE